MRGLEKIVKAVASRRRLAILQYLKNHREAPVGEIAGAIRLSFKATSKHLCILSAVDIVEKEQRSLQAYYALAKGQHPVIRQTLAML